MPLPRSDRPEWIQATQRRQEFVVLSEATHWISHWDTVKAKSRRCGGAECQLCQIGSPRVIRYVLLCVDGHGRERLLELRERHADYLDQLKTTHGSLAGLRCVVSKDGQAKNSPVSFRFLSVESCVRRDITLLVASFGLPPLLVGAPDVISHAEKLLDNS